MSMLHPGPISGLRGTVEQRGDRFVAKIVGLGVAGYGRTVTEAQASAEHLADLLVVDLYRLGGMNAVEARLAKAGGRIDTPGVGEWQPRARFMGAAGAAPLAGFAGVV